MEDVLDRPDEPNPKPENTPASEPLPDPEAAPPDTHSVDELLALIAANNPRAAARASFKLAQLLEDRGELHSVLGHYQGIWETGNPEVAPQAALVLVALAAQSKDYKLVTEAMRSVKDSPDTNIHAKANEVRTQLEASFRTLP